MLDEKIEEDNEYEEANINSSIVTEMKAKQHHSKLSSVEEPVLTQSEPYFAANVVDELPETKFVYPDSVVQEPAPITKPEVPQENRLSKVNETTGALQNYIASLGSN